MALQSQMYQASTGRRRYRSRRRSRTKWRWITALMLVVALVAYWLYPSGGGKEVAGPPQVDDAVPVTAWADEPSPTRSGPSSADEPSRSPGPAAGPPVAQDLEHEPVRRADLVTVVPEPSESAPTNQNQAEAAFEPPVLSRTSPVETASGDAAETEAVLPDENQSLWTPMGDIARGMNLINKGERLGGRRVLSDLLFNQAEAISAQQAHVIRDQLSRVNDHLIFSSKVVPGDPLIDVYTVKGGDILIRIAPAYKIPYQCIARINRLKSDRIDLHQRLKVVKGPFHAMVSKVDFRLDVYLHDPDGKRIYVRSFRIGLGEDDSTPSGRWIVRRGYKVRNPAWANPRTNERFGRDDPKNPIGEYWIGLRGIDGDTRDLKRYGIHGTIEPDTIGRQASMGCVRLLPDDIESLYHMLVEGHSTVEILP